MFMAHIGGYDSVQVFRKIEKRLKRKQRNCLGKILKQKQIIDKTKI